jgi:hypothetical protein
LEAVPSFSPIRYAIRLQPWKQIKKQDLARSVIGSVDASKNTQPIDDLPLAALPMPTHDAMTE